MAIYDWRKELGEIPESELQRPGRRKTGGHPMMDALKAPTTRKRAHAVLSKLLIESEGNLDDLAIKLNSSWHLAQRVVKDANLSEFAGTLRFENRRKGPTGLGITRGARSPTPTKRKPKPGSP